MSLVQQTYITSNGALMSTADHEIDVSLAEADPPVLPGAYVRRSPTKRGNSCESRYRSIEPSLTLRSSSCSLSDRSDTLTVPTGSGNEGREAPKLFSWEGVDRMFPKRFQIDRSTALGSHPAHQLSGSPPSFPSRNPNFLRRRSMLDLNAQYIRRNPDASYTARVMTVNATAPARMARRLPCHTKSGDATPPLSPRPQSLSISDVRRGPQLRRLGGYVPVDQVETLPLCPRVQAASHTVFKMKTTLWKVFTRRHKAVEEDKLPLLIGLPYDARRVAGYGTTFETMMAS